MSLSQGARWKALISKYIGSIPLSGDTPATEHNASTGPPPNVPVSSAMIAKVGAAARDSRLTARKAAAGISWWDAIVEEWIVRDAMIVELPIQPVRACRKLRSS